MFADFVCRDRGYSQVREHSNLVEDETGSGSEDVALEAVEH